VSGHVTVYKKSSGKEKIDLMLNDFLKIVDSKSPTLTKMFFFFGHFFQTINFLKNVSGSKMQQLLFCGDIFKCVLLWFRIGVDYNYVVEK